MNRILKLGNAKNGFAFVVLDDKDKEYLRKYQKLRGQLYEQKTCSDRDDHLFVSFDLKPLSHHISARIKQLQVTLHCLIFVSAEPTSLDPLQL